MLDFALRYLQILKTDLAGLNLTTILDSDEFYNKQILDSINPYLQSQHFKDSVSKTGLVVDIGFGGGFPLLPLAKLLPEVKFVGVESRNKKVEAVKHIANELKLSNVKVVHSRLEDFFFDKPATITFKAVGTAGDYLPLIQRASNDYMVFFYKGPKFMEAEGSMIQKVSREWTLVANEKVSVPGTEERYLVSFKAENVPRGTSKKLVKLSQFL